MRIQRFMLHSFLATGLVASLGQGAAFAQTQQQRNWCAGKDGASPDQQMSGCTAIIQAGRDAPKQLAII
jgi:hypothetical protein